MKSVQFLGINISSGQPHAGVSASSEKIRQYFATLKTVGLHILDQGNIEQGQHNNQKVHSCDEIKKINWQPYEKAYEKISQLLKTQAPVINWGGDHSIGISTVGAFTEQYPDGYVVWIDAHADVNLPEYSLSGNTHGMPLAFLLNLENFGEKNFSWLKCFLNPEKLIYVGLRDVDPFEQQILDKLKIRYYTAQDIKTKGMVHVAREISSICNHQNLHVSFDIDSVDPRLAPATGLHVPNGLLTEDLQMLTWYLGDSAILRSVDVVEVNPSMTDQMGVELTHSVALQFLLGLLLPQQELYKKDSKTFFAKMSNWPKDIQQSLKETTKPLFQGK